MVIDDEIDVTYTQRKMLEIEGYQAALSTIPQWH